MFNELMDSLNNLKNTLDSIPPEKMVFIQPIFDVYKDIIRKYQDYKPYKL